MTAHPFLEGLTAAQRDELTAGARERRFGAGAWLFHFGEDAEALYLIDRGRVSLEVNDPATGPTQLEQVRGGDILGLSWLFPPYRWHLDARAVEEVAALALPGAQLRALLEQGGPLGHHLSIRLLGKLYERLERARLQRLDVYRGRP
jgi:CRP-like cAMP-binding protein